MTDGGDDDGRRVRTAFLTYQATDEDAEVFMVVLGSVAENFRGVELVDFQDDTVFAEGEDPMVLLHSMATDEGRLTGDQLRQLREFGEQLAEWRGEESP